MVGWILWSGRGQELEDLAVVGPAGDERDGEREHRPEDALAQLLQMLEERHPRQLVLRRGVSAGRAGAEEHPWRGGQGPGGLARLGALRGVAGRAEPRRLGLAGKPAVRGSVRRAGGLAREPRTITGSWCFASGGILEPAGPQRRRRGGLVERQLGVERPLSSFVALRNSAMPRPSVRPISGSFLGPKISRARTKMKAISGRPSEPMETLQGPDH